MGRTRAFEESEVVDAAVSAFVRTGYEGTSVDDLVGVTGLHRGSIYGAFGSKRGLFLAGLRRLEDGGGLGDESPDTAVDLVLVALLELAPRDPQVRGILAALLAGRSSPGRVLGDRLLARAGLHSIDAIREGTS